MSLNLSTMERVAGRLLDTLKRFPLAALMALLCTIILIVLSDIEYNIQETLPHYNMASKVAYVMSIGFFLFVALRLISKNIMLTLLGIILLIGYYNYLPDDINKLSPTVIMQYPLILLSLLSLTVVAPFLSSSTSNDRFWTWTQGILSAAMIAILFSFILTIGLMGAIKILDVLFELSLGRYGEQLAIFIFGIFGTYFFLYQIPRYPKLLKVKTYSIVETIFSKYILTTLFMAYFLILYSYTLKILLLSEWPKGIIGWSVILFSALTIITYLFWTPFWNEKAKNYKKLLWVVVLLQTIVLAMAIYLRVEPYGWTIGRYFLASIGIWLFLLSLYFIVFKNASYRWIFISLPIFIMLTLFSPFSAETISKQSQQERLQTLLNLEKNVSEESNLSIRYQLSDSINYLEEYHGIESLKPIMPEIVSTYKQHEQNSSKAIKHYDFPSFATKQLGFKYISKWEWEELKRLKDGKAKKLSQIFRTNDAYNLYENHVLDIKGFDWIINFNYENYNHHAFPKKNISSSTQKITLLSSDKAIVLQENNNTIATIDILEFITKLQKNSTPNRYEHTLSQELLTYYYENTLVRVKFLFNVIELSSSDRVIHYRGSVLVNRKSKVKN